MDGDIVFDDDAPAIAPEAKKVVDFFKGEQAPTFGPEDVDNLAETPLAWTEICEPMLKELYTWSERRKSAVKNEKSLKEEFKGLLGLDRGMIQRGQYGAKVTETAGRKYIDWQRVVLSIRKWAEDQIGPDAKKEIDRIIALNEDPGVKQIKIQPYVVGKDPDEDSD